MMPLPRGSDVKTFHVRCSLHLIQQTSVAPVLKSSKGSPYMLRLAVSALGIFVLGSVCAAQNRPEMMAPGRQPSHAAPQKATPTPQPVPGQAFTAAPKPAQGNTTTRATMPSGTQAAAAGGSAAAQVGTPRSLLPLRPPRVSYSNGMLGIVAENSTLADVLNAVRQKTGASIEAPPSAANERVVISIGPAPANSVLTTLLNGSRFDYIIMGSEPSSAAPLRMILREKQATPQGPNQGNTQAFAQTPPAVPAEAPQPEEEYVPEAEIPDEVQPEAQPESEPSAAGQPNQQQPGQQQPGQQQVKTPEQLLEELKQMQQQQQQQQQQQGNQHGSQPQPQQNDPNARPQGEDQQQVQPQNMPPDGEAPPD